MSDIDRALEALHAIPPNLSRDEWHEVGRAGIAAGLSIDDLNRWSEPAENYKGRKDVESAFKTVSPNGGTTAATLFHIAKQHGYNGKSAAQVSRPNQRISKPTSSQTKDSKAASVADIWEHCTPATNDHEYITKKLALTDGVRVYHGELSIAGQRCDGALVLPSRSLNGELVTLQFIINGKKLFMPSVKLTADACFAIGGTLDNAERIYIAEGFGQACTAHQASRSVAVCCFGVGRMVGVSKALRNKFPKAELILIADAGKEILCAGIAADVGGKWIEMPNGKPANYDLNDFHVEMRDLHIVVQLLTQTKQPKPEEDIFSLDAFAMNGAAKEMESKMLDDKFVLGRLAILGQSTLWYAPPNIGKTLLMIHLLIDAIKRGEIDPVDVYFIDADDHHKGLIHKLKLAELHGFKLLAPSYNGFKPEMLAAILKAMVLQNKARGKILILDTAKKFTDIMDKKKASGFGESVRQFVMHGGTVVSMAHTNKHRDDKGNLIYGGTSDLVDDCDCAYTLDVVGQDTNTNIKTVKFTNFKARGDNALTAVYSYDFSEGLSYQDRLNSVRCLSYQEISAAEKRIALDEMLQRNFEAVDAIKQCIRDGKTKKTELIKAAMDLSALPRGRIATALKEHTGKIVADYEYWHLNVSDKNAHVYQLNYGAF